jgi:hypothetical protein
VVAAGQLTNDSRGSSSLRRLLTGDRLATLPHRVLDRPKKGGVSFSGLRVGSQEPGLIGVVAADGRLISGHHEWLAGVRLDTHWLMNSSAMRPQSWRFMAKSDLFAPWYHSGGQSFSSTTNPRFGSPSIHCLTTSCQESLRCC